jgi:hypothetical protein
MRSRRSDDLNAEVRDPAEQRGYSLFRIGLSLKEIPKSKNVPSRRPAIAREQAASGRVFPSIHFEEDVMGRGILLWLLGVPIPVIILLWLFFGR